MQLQKTRLVAPMDGIITDKKVEAGVVVAQANPVLSFASADNLEAEVYVSELDVKKLAVGNEAEIDISSVDGNSAAVGARIKNIYPAETIRNGVSSYKVVFELEEQNPNFKSGMTGTAKIKISEKTDVIYIPQSSLFSDAGKKYVMNLTRGFPERKEVQVGAYGADGMVEIISGLSEGDKIIKF